LIWIFVMLTGAICVALGAAPAAVIAYRCGYHDGTDHERARRNQADLRERAERRRRLADAGQRDPWVTTVAPKVPPARRPELSLLRDTAPSGITWLGPWAGPAATPPPDDDTRTDIPPVTGETSMLPSFTPAGTQPELIA
jgi:hypothetical protein